MAKIIRASRWEPQPIIYVIEGGWLNIARYDYRRFPNGRVTYDSVLSCMNRLRYQFNVHVILAGSRYRAEYVTVSLLKKRMREEKPQHWRDLWHEEDEE